MSEKVYIAKSKIEGAGRGMFATKAIKKGDVIEVCPVLIFEDEDDKLVSQTMLQYYVFEHSKNTSLLALGHGSLYNHSITPNAYYEIEENDLGSLLYFMAGRRILKDEEIYINYGPYYDEMYKDSGK